MRQIKKQHEPQKLRAYKAQEIGISYDEMDKDVYNDLLNNLLKEQFGLCAFCQQKLNIVVGEEYKRVSIEHHCERSICNGNNGTLDKTMDYKNLFAVCLGVGGKENEKHCDESKSKFSSTNGLPIAINPLEKDHISKIVYKKSGILKSTNVRHNDEIDRILNLNCNYLKDLRKRKWSLVWKSSNGNFKRMFAIIENDLALKNDKFNNNFPGLSEFMKLKFCSNI